MNRKLQHTIQALAASAAVFSLMLIAGGPAPVPAAAPQAGVESAGTGNRRHRRSHATTALPYFSFAQGLRQVAGS